MKLRKQLFLLLCLFSSAALTATDFDIVINEIHYNPPGGTDDTEFIELYNRGPLSVDLSGWFIEAGVHFTFPPGTLLGSHEYLVVAKDPAALISVHELQGVLGPWDADLANDGERIILRRSDASLIDFVRYRDNGDWGAFSDGRGASLELFRPLENNEFAWNWRSSAPIGGTPGGKNSTGAVTDFPVTINEVGFGDNPSWIEFYCPHGETVDLTGYLFASGDALSEPAALSTEVSARYTVVTIPFPPAEESGCYFLIAPDGTTIVDVFSARSSAGAVSSGYVPDGSRTEYAFFSPSPGASNNTPVTTDLFISEIMYHPSHTGSPPEEPLEQEYVCITNRGNAPWDVSGWSFNKGLQFVFPEGSIIESGDEIVVSKNPALFLQQRPELEASLVYGPFEGKLVNSAEKVYLRDETGNLVDTVRYADDGPWPPEADGGGAALCLRTDGIETGNEAAGLWEAVPGGNPGVPPSFNEIAPLVVDVMHHPAVPESDEAVLIECRIVDSDPITSVELAYSIDGADDSFTAAMHDDGQNGDVLAGDSCYAAQIGPFADGAVIAYHIIAADSNASTEDTDAPGTGKDFLFVVDNETGPVNSHHPYRVIMTEENWDILTGRSIFSDELLDATFIGDGGEVFYNAGIRYRGSSSRNSNPKSYRVQLTDAKKFHGIKKINLNRQDTDSQIISMDLFRRAGLPYCEEWMVNLWINGEWDDAYLRVEAVDEDYLSRLFGENNDTGILYRGFEIDDLHDDADFDYLGEDPDAYRPFYENTTGDWDNDQYAEIIRLCKAFSPDQTPDEAFAETIRELIDVEQWAFYFAVHACLSNNEGNLAKDKGDDYFVYFRPSDQRAVLLPWDFDDSFHDSAESLFRPTVDAVERFLEHPEFAPLYYKYLQKLQRDAFARIEQKQSVNLVKEFVSFNTWDGIEIFMTNRLGYLYENVPAAITSGMEEVSSPKLVAAGMLWRYFKGTEDPSGGDLLWTAAGFDDSTWPEGASGFGYGDGDDATVLSDMEDSYTTVFIRHRFTVENPAEIGTLLLSIDYDDGFATFLNGHEVARDNIPSGPPQSDWEADESHEAGTAESFDITGDIDKLTAGENVLAVAGVNRSADSSDFSLEPELLLGGGDHAGGGWGDRLYCTGSTVTLAGTADAAYTKRVEVAGAQALFSPLTARWQATIQVETGENIVAVQTFDAADELLEEKQCSIYRFSGLTTIAGTLSEDAVLTEAEGPYLITADVSVPSGITLSVEAGAVVLAEGAASLDIRGTLLITGTADKPVFFNSVSFDSPWNGIRLLSTGTSHTDPLHRISYCVFRTGENNPGDPGFLFSEDSRFAVEHCTFEDIRGNAIDATGSEVTVSDSVFERNYESIHCTNSEIVTITGCTFRTMIGDNDMIDFDGPSEEPCVISGCLFDGSMDDGLDLGGGANCLLMGNTFMRCEDKAFSIQGEVEPLVRENIFTANCTAVALKNGINTTLCDHNTIVGNIEGIALYAKTPGEAGSTASFHSSIVRHNKINVIVDEESDLEITYSNVESDSAWPGAGNINDDPLFALERDFDFRLQPGSPCIGTGLDGSDMGALPSLPPDIFIRGDANRDGGVDLSDGIFILLYLFGGNVTPVSLDACDANDNGMISLADTITVLSYLFNQGAAPPAPFPEAGEDPTADTLN